MQAAQLLYEYMQPINLHREWSVFLVECFPKISFQGIYPLE